MEVLSDIYGEGQKSKALTEQQIPASSNNLPETIKIEGDQVIKNNVQQYKEDTDPITFGGKRKKIKRRSEKKKNQKKIKDQEKIKDQKKKRSEKNKRSRKNQK